MPELAYVNGKILPIEKAVVPIEDRGYQFADAVYEGIASYNGNLFYLDAHLDRLERSMKALSFPAVSRDRISKAILELFERAGIARAFIYLQISRGVAPRNHAFPDAAEVQLRVYDLLGRDVATLVSGYQSAGRHQVEFHAGELASGVYFYRIDAGDFSAIRKMVLMKKPEVSFRMSRAPGLPDRGRFFSMMLPA